MTAAEIQRLLRFLLPVLSPKTLALQRMARAHLCAKTCSCRSLSASCCAFLAFFEKIEEAARTRIFVLDCGPVLLF
jgi:hypothetical protein